MQSKFLLPHIDTSFWQKAFYLKLDTLKLSEEPQEIFGTIRNSKFDDAHVPLSLDRESFAEKKFETIFVSYHEAQLKGLLVMLNKEKDFAEWIKNPELLAKHIESVPREKYFFVILLFTDHKTFNLRFSFFQFGLKGKYKDFLSGAQYEDMKFGANLDLIEKSNGIVFSDEEGKLFLNDSVISEKFICPFSLLHAKLHHPGAKRIIFPRNPVSLKKDNLEVSGRVLHLELKQEIGSVEFEPKQTIEDRQLNLKSFLSVDELVKDQSRLNLKLMKWRLEPKLDLEMLFKLKVLILGSGTLGCNLGRALSAYGVSHFTFLDYGRVSMSNLARQSLFVVENINQEGVGLPKAEAAKLMMKRIIPTLEVEAVNLRVPMPGHFIGEADIEPIYQDLLKLEELIRSHDLVFNVFDTREARYFPTVISALFNVQCVSIGIGYDSFVNVIHGRSEALSKKIQSSLESPQEETQKEESKPEEKILAEEIKKVSLEEEDKKEKKGLDDSSANLTLENYGCFFCSDYLPPSDTMSNRTLDQMCTVSRPGISMIAVGSCVESVINCLHQGEIGPSPHFFRGTFGSAFNVNDFTSSRFESCIACSEKVLRDYLRDRKEFLVTMLNNPTAIKNITGFSETNEDDPDMDEVIILDDFTD